MSTLLAAGLSAFLAHAPAAQPSPRDARVMVTVVDQTGAVIQGASVTIVGVDNPAIAPAAVKTDEKGVATLSGLAPGRYTLSAEFAGFEKGQLQGVRLKPGDNKHAIVLTIQGLQDS
ncbi:MAG TPA: carboxypeptidase-like regulatory domain-containing protein, partial [Vicinamibacterales bacterium]